MSLQQTLQQERADQAWARVKTIKGKSEAKEYGQLVRGLPSMIQQEGLATALAFLKAKGKAHHLAAYEHVSEWVLKKIAPANEKDILAWVLKQDSTQYRRATGEALAYLNWLKRFAEAEGLSSD